MNLLSQYNYSKSIYIIGTDGLKESLEEELGVECFGVGVCQYFLHALFIDSFSLIQCL